MDILDIPSSYVGGLVHTSALINFYNGEGSLGDRIMKLAMPRFGEPISYFCGMVTELAVEIAVPIYIAQTTGFKWYEVLAVDVAVKIIPRGLERLIMRKKKEKGK